MVTKMANTIPWDVNWANFASYFAINKFDTDNNNE